MTDVARDLFAAVADDRQWARLAPPSRAVVRRGEQLRAQRRARGRALLVALVVLLVLGPLLANSAGWRLADATTSVRPPVPKPVPKPAVLGVGLARLPQGAAPQDVPYAIGGTIYWRGAAYEVPADHGGPVTVVHAQPVQGLVLARVQDGEADVVGLVGPTLSWREVRDGAVDVVDGKLVVVDDRVSVVDPFTDETLAQLAPTGPGLTASASTVGQLVLVTYASALDGFVTSTVLWDYKTGRQTQLRRPADESFARWTVAQRRPPGWLAQPAGVGCVRLYELPGRVAVGQQLCSEGEYALSWDGTRAVVVRGGRLVVVSVADSRELMTAGLAGLPPAWAGRTTVLRPIAWEDDSHYLASVRLDDQLALVRCSALGPGCRRVVTSHVRDGVSEIVAGW